MWKKVVTEDLIKSFSLQLCVIPLLAAPITSYYFTYINVLYIF